MAISNLAISISVLLISGIILRVISTELNNRPIIGLLAQWTGHTYRAQYGDMYIYDAYVNYLQSGGARVVPVLDKKPDAYYKKLFNSINGLLLPGGDVSITNSSYTEAARIILDLAIQANDAGDYFPIWATCQGFETLTYFISGKYLLSKMDAENLPLPLDFSKGYDSSRLFGPGLSPDVYHTLLTQNVTAHKHHLGITPEAFYKDANLTSFFQVLSTNKDRNGKEFISTFEAYKYPIYASQWHPEKNTFIWDPYYHWLHSAAAIRVTQYFQDFFINEARKSQHKFPSTTDALNAVIGNYKRVFLGADFPFESMYVFNYTHRGGIERWLDRSV